MKKPPAGLQQAARDLQQRTGRRGLRKELMATLDQPVKTRTGAGGTRCSVGSGRGPYISWSVRDGSPDSAVGITITLDSSATSGDFDQRKYIYDLDGTFRHAKSVDFSAYFR